MENLLELGLEAHNPVANHHRRYDICVGVDLFGDWMVTFRYGRIGRGGQEVRHGSTDVTYLQSLIRQCLRRRLCAPQRIGCRYEVTKFSAVDNTIATEWLPSDVLQEFHTAPLAA